MKSTKEKIVDFILYGPTSSRDNCDEFDELLENYMETFACEMNEYDADLAYGFSDWISDIYYNCWSPNYQKDQIERHKTSTNEKVSDYPSLTNVTTTRLKRNFSEEEDLEILKFLIKNKKFPETKNNELWLSMEDNNILRRRSAQSMKERFNKKISPNLTMKLLCAIYAESL